MALLHGLRGRRSNTLDLAVFSCGQSRWEKALKELNGRPAFELVPAAAAAGTRGAPDGAYAALLVCIGTVPATSAAATLPAAEAAAEAGRLQAGDAAGSQDHSLDYTASAGGEEASGAAPAQGSGEQATARQAAGGQAAGEQGSSAKLVAAWRAERQAKQARAQAPPMLQLR